MAATPAASTYSEFIVTSGRQPIDAMLTGQRGA
jgi:hypothetical protein